MLEGTFVTITGFKNYYDRYPFSIGTSFLCQKEPENVYDTEAICVWGGTGCKVGYIANSTNTKANGTMSAARIYDRVGEYFLIEACFSTNTKIICKITNFNVQDVQLIESFSRDESDISDFEDDELQ